MAKRTVGEEGLLHADWGLCHNSQPQLVLTVCSVQVPGKVRRMGTEGGGHWGPHPGGPCGIIDAHVKPTFHLHIPQAPYQGSW